MNTVKPSYVSAINSDLFFFFLSDPISVPKNNTCAITWWANKNEKTLVHPTAATIQGKIKQISPKCSLSFQE